MPIPKHSNNRICCQAPCSFWLSDSPEGQIPHAGKTGLSHSLISMFMLWSWEEILQIVVKTHFAGHTGVCIPSNHMTKSLPAQLFEYLNLIGLSGSSLHLKKFYLASSRFPVLCGAFPNPNTLPGFCSQSHRWLGNFNVAAAVTVSGWMPSGLLGKITTNASHCAAACLWSPNPRNQGGAQFRAAAVVSRHVPWYRKSLCEDRSLSILEGLLQRKLHLPIPPREAILELQTLSFPNCFHWHTLLATFPKHACNLAWLSWKAFANSTAYGDRTIFSHYFLSLPGPWR